MNVMYTTTGDATALMSALAVTPNDSTDLIPPNSQARPTRGVLVGSAGTLAVNMADGSSVSITIPSTACGVILPLAVMRIKASGTTATAIVAFY